MDLTGKAALITGSARGIGRAIAERYVRAGAKVALNCVRSVEQAETTAAFLREKGGEAIVIPADVGDRAEARRLVRECIEYFGALDIVVANAGVIVDKPFLENTEEDWHYATHNMLDAYFHLSQACLPHMIERGHGRLLATTSIISERYDFGPNKMAVCTAAKAGIANMMRSIATEVADKGVTVNAVSPGYIATEMFETIDQAGKDAAIKMIPMARYGDPMDVANAMCFLASDEAAYITGQTIRVNGGMFMG